MTRIEHSGLTPVEYSRANGLSLDWVYRLVRMGISHIRMYGGIIIAEPKAERIHSIADLTAKDGLARAVNYIMGNRPSSWSLPIWDSDQR